MSELEQQHGVKRNHIQVYNKGVVIVCPYYRISFQLFQLHRSEFPYVSKPIQWKNFHFIDAFNQSQDQQAMCLTCRTGKRERKPEVAQLIQQASRALYTLGSVANMNETASYLTGSQRAMRIKLDNE